MDVEDSLLFQKLFSADSFDTVFWGDNIEHLYNPENTINEIKRVLKFQGRLILSFPNSGWWYDRYYHLKYGKLYKSEGGTEKPWEWQHIRFFNLDIIREFIGRYGFRINKVYGVMDNKYWFQSKLTKIFPTIFGSILIIEAIKEDVR